MTVGRYRAGLVSRVIAVLIDVLVLTALGMVILLFLAGVRTVLVGTTGATSVARELLAGGTPLLAASYLAAGWATTGRTLGQQVVGLRVVSRNGRRLRPAKAVLRAVICVIFPIGLLWVLVSRRNLALHDILVGTAVIYDWSYAPADGEPAARLTREG